MTRRRFAPVLAAVVAAALAASSCSSGGGDEDAADTTAPTTIVATTDGATETTGAATAPTAGPTTPSTLPPTTVPTTTRPAGEPTTLPAGEVATGEPIDIGPAVKTTIPPPKNPGAVPVTDPAPVVGPDGAPMFPLTGLTAPSASAAARPVLTVKIDNAAPARPQTGLDKADVVVEEQVEGGEVRFMALFQSTGSDPVGPIRSVRPVDPVVLTPFGGLFAYSGGTNRFVNLLRRAPLLDVGTNVKGSVYFRSSAKKAPYNLYSRTTALWAAGATGWRGPSRVWDFLGPGEAWAPAGARPASRVSVRVSPRITAGWVLDPATQRWKRQTNGRDHLVAGGGPILSDNVVVQFTEYRNTTARDRSNAPVPEASVVGTGRAVLLSGGRAVRGTWSKVSADAPFVYRDEAGAVVRFTRGRTWILLAPASAYPGTVTP